MKKCLVKIIILSFFILQIFWPLSSSALIGRVHDDNYPRLANYFLKWTLTEREAEELSHWDVLVLDMEVSVNSPDIMRLIRRKNPDIIILAYITSQEIRRDSCQNDHAKMRCDLYKRIPEDWYLHDPSGQRLSFWQGTDLINISTEAPKRGGVMANHAIAEFVQQRIMLTGLWDGVFYDNIWGDISWFNGGNIDIDNNGRAEGENELNRDWSDGVRYLLKKTRELIGDKAIIVGNGSPNKKYQEFLNGNQLESFPSPWINGGDWSSSMQFYFYLRDMAPKPEIRIINSSDHDRNNYRSMRFGLTSALLGDAYYSFDYGVENHADTWWYDEYNFNLGYPLKAAERQDGSPINYGKGIWLRHYQNGLVYVNSTGTGQWADLPIRMRTIDIRSSGVKILESAYLPPYDGVILEHIVDTVAPALLNCKEYEVLDFSGKKREEHYEFCDNQFGALVRVRPLKDGSGYEAVDEEENITDEDRDGKLEKVEKIAYGGESWVKVFNYLYNGLLGVFAAFPIEFHCGVKTAVGDVDGDGRGEIVATPAWGGPHMKIFSFGGKLLNEFFFGNKRIRLNYDVVTTDIDNDGVDEILVSGFK